MAALGGGRLSNLDTYSGYNLVTDGHDLTTAILLGRSY
jgi:hypothetical protein